MFVLLLHVFTAFFISSKCSPERFKQVDLQPSIVQVIQSEHIHLFSSAHTSCVFTTLIWSTCTHKEQAMNAHTMQSYANTSEHTLLHVHVHTLLSVFVQFQFLVFELFVEVYHHVYYRVWSEFGCLRSVSFHRNSCLIDWKQTWNKEVVVLS